MYVESKARPRIVDTVLKNTLAQHAQATISAHIHVTIYVIGSCHASSWINEWFISTQVTWNKLITFSKIEYNFQKCFMKHETNWLHFINGISFLEMLRDVQINMLKKHPIA